MATDIAADRSVILTPGFSMAVIGGRVLLSLYGKGRMCYKEWSEKQSLNFTKGKNMARENDVVLIYLEDTPVSFARVESIEPDVKKDWYHITLLMLHIPLQTVTWTLKDLYINGEDFFMGGKRMKIEVVETPPEAAVEETEETDVESPKEDLPGQPPQESRGKVISLADVRARNKKSSKP